MTSAYLPIRQLRNQFIKAATEGALAGSAVLEKLSEISEDIARSSTQQKRVVAYCLENLFRSLADKYTGRPVYAHEALSISHPISQTILTAIAFLNDEVPFSDCLNIVIQLVDIEIELASRP